MRLAVMMLAGVLLFSPATTCAQVEGDGDAALADELAVERLAQRGERYAEGMWLLTYGIGSIVAGGVIAAVGHEDPFWLWAGLGSAGWGAINLWFGLPMMDLGGGNAREIEAQRALRGDALDDRREDLASDQYGAAGVLAFNGGLDVFYIATGIFLAVVGAELLDTRSPELAGYGVAMAAQGLGLLAFDVFGWIRAQDRGHRLQRLDR